MVSAYIYFSHFPIENTERKMVSQRYEYETKGSPNTCVERRILNAPELKHLINIWHRFHSLCRQMLILVVTYSSYG